MAHPDLVSYVTANKDKFQKQVLVQTLLASGWELADITAAFVEVEHPIVSIGITDASSASAEATFLAEMEQHRKQAALSGQQTNEISISSSPAAFAPRQIDQKGIVGMLMKLGAKNEQQANIIMICFVVVVLGVCGWIIL